MAPLSFVEANGGNPYKREASFCLGSRAWFESLQPLNPHLSLVTLDVYAIPASSLQMSDTSAMRMCQKVEFLCLSLSLDLVVSLYGHWSQGLWRRDKEEKWIWMLTLSFLFLFLSLILGQEARKEEGKRERSKRDRGGKETEVETERRQQVTKKGSFYKNDYRQAK